MFAPSAGARFAAIAAGFGVRGVGFAEDADDDTAEKVAGLIGIEILRGVAVARQLGEGLDQSLEARVAIATVEGGEGIGSHAGSGEADPGGDAGGGEIALVPGNRLQCLVLRPTLQPCLPQGSGDVRPPGLQFGRLAQ